MGMKALVLLLLGACNGSTSGTSDVDAPSADVSAALDASIDASSDASATDRTTDDFERSALGNNWMIVFPPPPNDQVRIIGDSDLGMGPGTQGFFLATRINPTFSADQFCEATIPTDVTSGWAHQVYVRWRATDKARYGFGYDNDPNQAQYGSWYFKYDGVPSAQTRYFATTPASPTFLPGPGDTLRVEIRGYTLRGYLNGTKVLEATDTDASKIADGPPGLAARWANGNTQTSTNVKVWESWAGGSL